MIVSCVDGSGTGKVLGNGIGSGQFCDCLVVGKPPITPVEVNAEILVFPKVNCLIVLFFIVIIFNVSQVQRTEHYRKISIGKTLKVYTEKH